MAEFPDPLVGASRIDPVRLGHALAVRGKSWTDLTRGEHRLNATTVTKLRKGGAVGDFHPSTLRTLGLWLQANPPMPELSDVVVPMDGAA